MRDGLSCRAFPANKFARPSGSAPSRSSSELLLAQKTGLPCLSTVCLSNTRHNEFLIYVDSVVSITRQPLSVKAYFVPRPSDPAMAGERASFVMPSVSPCLPEAEKNNGSANKLRKIEPFVDEKIGKKCSKNRY